MKLRNRWVVSALLFTVMGFSSIANAALVGRLAATPGGTDYQAYYDDVANLTWLADANTAGTTMSWADAEAWAADLTIAGVGGWHLPDTLQPDPTCSSEGGGLSAGSGCTGSDMGNLFYNVLGGVAGTSIATTHNPNYGLFTNIDVSSAYWSTDTGTGGGDAFFYSFALGGQGFSSGGSLYAWAVHSGDVSAVPIPATVWLFGSGLLGLIGFAKKRNKS